MKNCLITAATEDYLKRAQVLYLSYKKYFPNTFFDITLINCNKNNYFNNINDPKLSITYINNDLNNDELKNYASNIRCKLLYIKIHKYNYIYWFDADSIIVKNISEINNYFINHDLFLYKNKEVSYKKNQKIIFKTGILGFKKNYIIINFLKEWYSDTFKEGNENCYWFQDQILITKLLIKYHNYLKIGTLDKKFIDWDLNKESFIWVGKGNIKNEFKYLNMENNFV